MKPHQWSFAKQCGFKKENIDPEVPKQAEAERDGVINPQNYNYMWRHRRPFLNTKMKNSREIIF